MPVQTLLTEVWRLRRSVRISDASYVALAAAWRAPLLTADLRLAQATLPGLSVLTVSSPDWTVDPPRPAADEPCGDNA